jgi:S-DNA-T family DNA segregation ATPase FtsK/SpoIIIE
LIKLGVGWGSLFVIATGFVLGIWMLKQQVGESISVIWMRVFALEGAVFALIAFFTVLGGHSLARARQGLDGGLVGWGLVEAISSVIGLIATGVLAFISAAIGAMIGLGFTERVRNLVIESQEEINVEQMIQNEIDLPPQEKDQMKTTPEKRKRSVPPEFKKQFKVDTKSDLPVDAPPRDKGLPKLDLLTSGKSFKPNQRHINTSAGLIEKTLAEFGIPAQVVGFRVGPTVTQFAVKPGYLDDDTDEERKKVRVSRITSLKNDLALALSAKQLRIEAPVPGRSYVGIEVPNEKSYHVTLRSVMETDDFYQLDSPLAIALGSDVSG